MVAFQTVFCGGISCASPGSYCLTIHVVRSGMTSSQTLWVSAATGATYLPLAAQVSPPFPTIAQVTTAGVVAPNVATYTNAADPRDPLFTAYSCVRLVVNAAGGASIDATDDTFAVTHNEATDVYSAGVPAPGGYWYGAPYACTGSLTEAEILDGGDPTAAYGNVNLSGTPFIVLGGSCNGSPSCTCTGGDGWTDCPAFFSATSGGAARLTYSPPTQSVVMIADGWCGGVGPSPDPRSLLLDGVVVPTVSGTPTASPSQGPTPSSTTTASSTETRSQTQSQTPSVTLTPSLTLTPSTTPTSTPSLSGSMSRTQSGSQTYSPTQSITASLTSTPSASCSQSRSPTPTPSQTISRTQTQSRSQTLSSTPVGTVMFDSTRGKTALLDTSPVTTLAPPTVNDYAFAFQVLSGDSTCGPGTFSLTQIVIAASQVRKGCCGWQERSGAQAASRLTAGFWGCVDDERDRPAVHGGSGLWRPAHGCKCARHPRGFAPRVAGLRRDRPLFPHSKRAGTRLVARACALF